MSREAVANRLPMHTRTTFNSDTTIDTVSMQLDTAYKALVSRCSRVFASLPIVAVCNCS